jgi:hypothetical protein
MSVRPGPASYDMIYEEQMMVEGTDRFAYAIFSEYIPLAKNKTRVVTETESNPRVKYGWI